MATPAWELIDSNTLSASASSVTFSAIPQGYRDLILVMDYINIAGQSVMIAKCEINSDTGANYEQVWMDAYGSGTTSNTIGYTGYISMSLNDYARDTWRNQITFQFLDYSATDKHKAMLGRGGNPNTRVTTQAVRWANTSAITQLRLFADGTDAFDVGSTFYLWGLNRL